MKEMVGIFRQKGKEGGVGEGGLETHFLPPSCHKKVKYMLWQKHDLRH